MHSRNPMLRWQDPPSRDEDAADGDSSERDSDVEGSTECIELLSDEDDDVEVIEILSSDLEDDEEEEEDIQVRRRAGSFSIVCAALRTGHVPTAMCHYCVAAPQADIPVCHMHHRSSMPPPQPPRGRDMLCWTCVAARSRHTSRTTSPSARCT